MFPESNSARGEERGATNPISSDGPYWILCQGPAGLASLPQQPHHSSSSERYSGGA